MKIFYTTLICFGALTACSHKRVAATTDQQNDASKPLAVDSKAPSTCEQTRPGNDLAGITKSFGLEDFQTGVTFKIVDSYNNIYAATVSRHKACGIYFFKKSANGEFSLLENELPTSCYLDIDKKAYRIPEEENVSLGYVYPLCSKFDREGNLFLWLVACVIDDQSSDEQNRELYYINKYTISAKDQQLKIITRSVGEVYTDEQSDLMNEMEKKDGVN